MKKKQEVNNEEDAFLREVEEDLKNESLKKLWDKYWLFIVVFVTAVLTLAVSYESIKSWYVRRAENWANAYSVASGLDYPGVGPKHCYLKDIGRVKYELIRDLEAVNAFYTLSREEGIIPALESSHAVALGLKLAEKCSENETILINVSGRGDKDIDFVMKNYPLK